MFLFQIFKQKSVKNLVSCPLGKQHLIKVKTPLQKEYPVSFQVALLLYKKKNKNKRNTISGTLANTSKLGSQKWTHKKSTKVLIFPLKALIKVLWKVTIYLLFPIPVKKSP